MYGPAWHGGGDDALRFGIAYEDGRQVEAGPRSMDRMERGDDGGLSLVPQGGRATGGHWDQQLWLWPLPERGDIIAVCRWLEHLWQRGHSLTALRFGHRIGPARHSGVVTPSDDDSDLVVELREPEGFVALYRREAELVLMFCTRRVLDAETALDLTAETFAQAFRGRTSFRGSTLPQARAWLLTIARRQIAGYLRRGSLDRRALRRLAIQTPALDPGQTEEIERRAGAAAIRAELAEQLARLNDDQRDALALRVVEQRPYEEVARSLGITEATARPRVSRGLRALAAGLEPRPLTAQEEP
jgi:RNA polymerase sigma-70 factor (ECF subfamily)